MPTEHLLVEIPAPTGEAFSAFSAAAASDDEAVHQAERLLERLAGRGVVLTEDHLPIPMFTAAPGLDDAVAGGAPPEALRGFGQRSTNADMGAVTAVVPVAVDRSRVDELRAVDGIRVWPNSPLSLLPQTPSGPVPSADVRPPVEGVGPAAERVGERVLDDAVVDLATSRRGVDCRPFRDAVPVSHIRGLLGVDAVWQNGFHGQNTTVAILDEGIDGSVYPVVGGFSRPGARAPGTAPVTSHGSMCAADVLVAAPWTRLTDYPFLGVPRSGGAIAMFQAVLEQRRLDGTPDITSNSYGFVGVPPEDRFPDHEVHDPQHPLHRKVREVVAAGVTTFFAAGNCGQDCPSGACQASGIGPGRSIHASNSLEEVITVAAVNAAHERIGYSSQGPGMFAERKPDLAAYSHFFGNFGPGRPGGDGTPFDNGTSAACPVAAGTAALLISAGVESDPDRMRAVLLSGLVEMGGDGWDAGYGHGIINAAASYSRWLAGSP